MWFVYMVEGADGSLYTGITTDVARRVRQHNVGEGAKSLRGRLPVRLVHREEAATRAEAAKREREIKRLSRERKLAFLAAARESEQSPEMRSREMQEENNAQGGI